jgi:hypothetical protein
MQFIDCSNLLQLLPEITNAIKNCAFLAMDLEFSGLYVDFGTQRTKFDSIEDYYQKCKDLAQHHHLLQLGLTCFFWNSITFNYDVKVFAISLNDFFMPN